MSIASEITRINGNIAAAYTALDGKGATLPAAGSQNSANLADTIDTITTGGGSNSDAKHAAFEWMKTYIGDSALLNKSNQELVSDGWTIYEEPNSTNAQYSAINRRSGSICGYVFNEALPNKIYTNIAYGLKAPDDAVITEIKNGNNHYAYEIDYTNSQVKWIILPMDNSGLFSSGYNSYLSFSSLIGGTSYNSTQSNLVLSFIEYSCYSLLDSTYTSSNRKTYNLVGDSGSKVSVLATGLSTFLKDFYISDNIQVEVNLDATNANSFCPHLIPVSRAVSSKKVLNAICPQYTYGQTALSAAFSKAIITNAYGSNYVAYSTDFPFVLDCSTLTGTNTLYIQSPSAYTALNTKDKWNSPVYSLYIILPSVSSVYWCGSYDGVAIPIECLQFMATNAPTVSGKTLTIGSYNIARAGGASGTIISTLTEKGWTVQ